MCALHQRKRLEWPLAGYRLIQLVALLALMLFSTAGLLSHSRVSTLQTTRKGLPPNQRDDVPGWRFQFSKRIRSGVSRSSSRTTLTAKIRQQLERLPFVSRSKRTTASSNGPLYASTSDVSNIQTSRKGVVTRIRGVFAWVRNRLVLNPLKGLVELAVDSLDKDGTTVVSSNTNDSSLQFEVTTVVMEDSSSTRTLPSSSVADQPQATTTTTRQRTEPRETPLGDRWAIAAPGVDLSGHWSLIVDDGFKKEYSTYLTKLGQPYLVRSVALGIVPMTTETSQQSDQGRSLFLSGRNLQWGWDRTLVASGTDQYVDEYSPLSISIMTAESELVQAESWWEDNGTVHVSWLRGVTKYGGGAFESRRYLEENGTQYVCETTFHRKGKEDKASIVWRFRRQEEEQPPTEIA